MEQPSHEGPAHGVHIHMIVKKGNRNSNIMSMDGSYGGKNRVDEFTLGIKKLGWYDTQVGTAAAFVVVVVPVKFENESNVKLV